MDPILLSVIICGLVLAFGIGTGDETTAPLVGCRAMKLWKVVLLGGLFAALGTIFFSERVAKTIGSNLLTSNVDYGISMLLAVILSTTTWLIIGALTGAPISTTHSIVGSIFGVGLIYGILNDLTLDLVFHGEVFIEIVISWVLSPVLGFIGAVLMQYMVNKIIISTRKGLIRAEKTEQIFQYLLIITIIWTSFSRGGNDSAKAIGIFYGLLENGSITSETMGFLYILTAIMFFLGLVTIGRKVVHNVGINLVEMKPSDAFAIQLAASLVIFISTLAGWPVSGGHILIFSIIGTGLMKGERPEKKPFLGMIKSWLFTFPVAAILSSLLYLGLNILL